MSKRFGTIRTTVPLIDELRHIFCSFTLTQAHLASSKVTTRKVTGTDAKKDC